jgi:ATP-binding cassette subfamily B protein/ATP-binding cassette subfamily C protein
MSRIVTMNDRGEVVPISTSEYKQNLRNTYKTTKYMLDYVLKEKKARTYTFVQVLMALYGVLPTIIYTVFPGLIITELTEGKRIPVLAIYLSVLVVTPIIDKLIRRVSNVYLTRVYKNLGNKFLRDYDYHSAMMDYETFEKPDIQNINERIYGTFYNALSVIDRLTDMLSALLGLTAIFFIVANLNAFIVVVVLFVMFLNSRITKKQNAKNHEIDKAMIPHQRYIGSSLIFVLHGIWTAKEVRLFDLKDYFADMLYKERCKGDEVSLDYTRNGSNAGILYALSNFIQQFLMYIYLIYMVLFKSLSIGMMTIYMSAVSQFAGAFNGIVNSYMSMEKSGIEIHELMEFMNTPIKQYETGTKEPVFDDDSTIEFRNVSFKYPGSDAYALKNMSIKMRANEKLCIVGANGSGKTTFIKLLTRLYFPTEGEILLNGININEYDYEKYQRLFSPVFQDYSLYTLPLRDNIALSNEQDEERIIELCKKCGLSYLLEKLPNGINTSVYKNFDGEGFEPSGGEGQRIAIARALYHCSSICLLDEPTAALDPVSEYDIYTQFNSMITNKCAVLITHRLSAVQLADKVAVFEKGQLVEYGTHTELHAKGGIYTEMFDKQAQFYRNDPTGDDASE